MKFFTYLFVVLVIQLMLSCTGSSSLHKDFEKIDWLIGYWERINVREGRSAHERWEIREDSELNGWGVSLQGKDTTFMEKLRILSEDGALYYVADVAENAEPVYFKFTHLNKDGFTCENPRHDFPKKIQYLLHGDSLKAITSGDGKELVFEFVKSKK